MTDTNPVTALLMVLDQQLLAASLIAKSAYEAGVAGDQNLAIGTLLPAERYCEEAAALFRVILSLHRTQRDAGQIGGGR